jgi:hypothetical protein
MINAAAWTLFILGFGHLVFGLVKFRVPLAETVAAGFIGKFYAPQVRQTAFWFLILSPLAMCLGQVALHAIAQADLALLKMVGVYSLVTAVAGVAAFPKAPFWVLLAISPVLIAGGAGLLPLA